MLSRVQVWGFFICFLCVSFCLVRFGKQNFNWLVLFGSGRTVKHRFGRSLVEQCVLISWNKMTIFWGLKSWNFGLKRFSTQLSLWKPLRKGFRNLNIANESDTWILSHFRSILESIYTKGKWLSIYLSYVVFRIDSSSKGVSDDCVTTQEMQ